ncbi:MAG: tetratricopeptide repeat protein [Myxococcota bacterium]
MAERDQTLTDGSRQSTTLDHRLQAGTLVERYRVLHPLGKGGMSEVYAAYDPRLDRSIALKIMKLDRSDEAHARLQREGRAIARLGHRNVVVVHDVGVFGEELFVAMEHVHGEPLARWIRSTAGWRAIAGAFVQAADALVAAHAADIIHRDFKPANAMVEADTQRVVVLDFGLARVRDQPTHDSEPNPCPASGSLDATHSAVGTVGYMAPELMGGDGASESTDQFAFCVSLYEALYGQRPFRGRHVLELLDAMNDGPPEPVERRGVPGWLHALVRKGLAPDPADRHASMRTLRDELASGLAPAAPRAAWGWLGGLLLAGIGGTAYALSEPGVDPCEGAELGRLSQTWGDEQRAAVEAGLAASERPHATSTTPNVLARIDRFATSWTQTAEAACRRAPSSPDASVLAVDRCLDRALVRLDVTVETLAGAETTPSVADHAMELALSLPAVQRCLSAPGEPPGEDAPVTEAIARSVAARITGSLEGATEASNAAVEASTEASPSRRVDALLERARVHDSQARYDQALEDAAAALAEATEHELAERQARAALELVRLCGDRLRRFDEAARWTAVARSLVGRLPNAIDLRAQLDWVEGTVLWRRGKADEAQLKLEAAAAALDVVGQEERRAGVLTELGLVFDELGQSQDAQSSLDAALSLRRELFGPQHPAIADALADLAVVAGRASQSERALALGGEALEIYVDHVDPDHPHVATIALNIALEHQGQGHFEQALAFYARAESIRRQRFGDDHVLIAAVQTNRSTTYMALGRTAEARLDLERALAILEREHGPKSASLVNTLTNLGNLEADEDRLDQALAYRTRAHDLGLASLGPTHPAVGIAAQNLGEVWQRRDDCRRATTYYERALGIFESSLGPAVAEVAYPLTSMGECATTLGDAEEAVRLLQRALEVRTANPTPPADRGHTALALAAAHHALSPGCEDAHAAAATALRAFDEAGAAGRDQKVAAELWLAETLPVRKP